MRTRVARSNFAASRSKISARRPERFAGESRKIRLFATAFEGDIVSNIQGERSEFKKAAQNRNACRQVSVRDRSGLLHLVFLAVPGPRAFQALFKRNERTIAKNIPRQGDIRLRISNVAGARRFVLRF